MIEIERPRGSSSDNKPKQTAESQKKEVAIPFFAHDCEEVDFIRKKIAENREYLSKCTTQSLYTKVERETLYLENHILPILLQKTNLFFNDMTAQFVGKLDKAIQAGCNSILVYLPITDQYTNNPVAGIANFKDFKISAPGELGVEISAEMRIFNRDGNFAPFKYLTL